MLRKISFSCVILVILGSTQLPAEQSSVDLTSIMPRQDILRVKRGVIGAGEHNYRSMDAEEIPQNSLLIEDRLGVKTDEVEDAIITVGRTDISGDDNILLLPPDDADDDQDYTRLKFHPGNLGGFINYEPDWGFTLRQVAHTGVSFGHAQILRAYVPYWNDPRVGIGYNVHDTSPSDVGDLLPKAMLSVGNLQGNRNAEGTPGIVVGPTGNSDEDELARIELYQDTRSAGLTLSDNSFRVATYDGSWTSALEADYDGNVKIGRNLELSHRIWTDLDDVGYFWLGNAESRQEAIGYSADAAGNIENLHFKTRGEYRMTVDDLGHVSLPAYSGPGTLEIDGDGQINVENSSKRYKEDIEPLDEDFSRIMQVQPKSFRFKESGRKGIGYIAEDLDELGLDKLVRYNKKGQPESISYDKISLYLLEVVKHQQAEIEKLKNMVK